MASFYYFYQNPSGFCFFVQIKGFCYLNLTRSTKFKYSRLTITRTLAKSNQNRFPLDFFHTYTVILTSVTRALDNSNLPLTRSCFCFPSDDLYIILPSILKCLSPIIFLFSYLKLHLIKITSAKKFCDLNQRQFF